MTDYPDRPGYSFNPGPPPEASRFLKNKGMRPGFSWMDVEAEEHAVAFTAAKAMETDLLEAMRGEVQKALDQGLPFAAFKKSWRNNPALTEWWGKKEMVDPLTGATELVQLGSPRRLRTIYNANIRSARAAGQWERIERTKAAFPYLEYRLGPSERHRAHHETKAGLILAVDNPFWDEWMPPNGWGCKCWVRQVTKREAERRGISVTPDVPDTVWDNKRTGARHIIPQGIDPGWQRNPGKLRLQAMETILKDKIAALPAEVARVAIRDIATSWRAERVLLGNAPGAVPVAVMPSVLASDLGTGTTIVQTTSSYGEKFQAKGRDVTTATLALLNEALETGTIAQEGAQLHVFTAGEPSWHFVLKLMPSVQEIWVNTMHRTSPEKRAKVLARAGVSMVRQ
jgi:hypothetical protein